MRRRRDATIGALRIGIDDEYEFVVHPRVTSEAATLFAGESKYVELRFADSCGFGAGAEALRYGPQ